VQWPTDAPSDLADDVVCLWSAEMAAGERLVPDGCIDLVWIPQQGRLWVCGPERTAWISPTPEGTTAVGARLRPGSAPRLLRTDASDLADRRVELPAVVPGRQGRLTLDRLADSADPLTVLVDEVRRLRDRADPRSASDEHIVRSATQHRTGRVGDLADEVGLTPRQLHRRCERLFGYGYSVLARLIRFQRFLHLARSRPDVSLGRLAALAGYADQPHLDHDCRAIAGITPSELLTDSEPTFPSTMSDPYKTTGSHVGSLAS
jgi:AraC-like DNA-binding protein